MSKRTLLIYIFSIFNVLNIFSQLDSDSLLINKPKKVELSSTKDDFMINLTIDNCITNSSDTTYKSEWFNPNIGFYYMYDIPFGNSGFSYGHGIGFTFSKVNLKDRILTQDSLGTYFEDKKYYTPLQNNNVSKYNSSSFYNSWMEMPMELRYKSKALNGRSRIKIAAGFRIGIKLGTNSKYEYLDKYNDEITFKQKPFIGISSIRYGTTFRIGYGAFSLFGYYGLNQLLSKTTNYKNSDIKQYSIGISISGN